MPEILRYINKDSTPGGDGTTNATSGANRAYASFSEWQTAEAASLGADWHHLIVIGAGEMSDNISIGTAAGWGANDFILIEVDESSRAAGGVPKTGFFVRKSVGSAAIIDVRKPYVYIIGLDVENTHVSGHGFAVGAGVNNRVLFKNCISKAGSTAYRLAPDTGGLCGIFDSIAYDSAVGVISPNWIHSTVQNCTIDNCTDGIKKLSDTGTGRITAKNTVIIGGTNKYATPLANHFNTGASSNNASDAADTSAIPGPNPLANIATGAFSDYAGNDFSHEAGGALIDSGVASSSEYSAFDRAEYTVTVSDIIETTRPQGAAWDIGAFEFIGGGGGGFVPAWIINANNKVIVG
jgi:hypothetical protein